MHHTPIHKAQCAAEVGCFSTVPSSGQAVSQIRHSAKRGHLVVEPTTIRACRFRGATTALTMTGDWGHFLAL